MCVCKSIKNRCMDRMRNFSKVSKKQEKKKNHMKRLSFITQFKIEYTEQPQEKRIKAPIFLEAVAAIEII